jgi:hypothetical protein
MRSISSTTTSGDVVVRLIELHSFQFIGNPKVGPQVLSFGVDRIQWGLEPMRNHAENCFEFIGSGGRDLGVVLSSIP